MPNLWTKSTQTLSEAFKGPRTKDTEFDKKIEEFKGIERGINNLRNLLKNYNNLTLGIKNINKEIISCVTSIYSNSHYDKVSNYIVDLHTSIEKSYCEMVTNIHSIYLKTDEWLSGFNAVKESIEKRNISRKDYDHYDEKLEKIIRQREEKLRKGESSTVKDHEFYERNEKKYKKSTENYVNSCNQAYESMNRLLDNRFIMINPLIRDFLFEEKHFYDNVYRQMSRIDQFNLELSNLDRTFSPSIISYDPCIYIRGGKIIQSSPGENVNENENYDMKQNKRSVSQVNSKQNTYQSQSQSQFNERTGKNYEINNQTPVYSSSQPQYQPQYQTQEKPVFIQQNRTSYSNYNQSNTIKYTSSTQNPIRPSTTKKEEENILMNSRTVFEVPVDNTVNTLPDFNQFDHFNNFNNEFSNSSINKKNFTFVNNVQTAYSNYSSLNRGNSISTNEKKDPFLDLVNNQSKALKNKSFATNLYSNFGNKQGDSRGNDKERKGEGEGFNPFDFY